MVPLSLSPRSSVISIMTAECLHFSLPPCLNFGVHYSLEPSSLSQNAQLQRSLSNRDLLITLGTNSRGFGPNTLSPHLLDRQIKLSAMGREISCERICYCF